jgi:hypothetical protein
MPALNNKQKAKHTMTNEEYDKLPVIYWKEILGEIRKGVYTRRPRRMHATLKLDSARWWIQKLFGIPRQAIQFVEANGRAIPDSELNATFPRMPNGRRPVTTVKDLQGTYLTLLIAHRPAPHWTGAKRQGREALTTTATQLKKGNKI